jgi:hypothetical protein
LVGGLVGDHSHDRTVSDSAARGSIDGPSEVGGFVGQLDSEYVDKRQEATLRDSYFDTLTTGQRTAVGTIDQGGGTTETQGEVTGLTTSQMQGTSAEQTMSALDFANT